MLGRDSALAAIHISLTLVMAWFCVAMLLPGDTLSLSSFKAFHDINPSDRWWAVGFAIAAVVGVVGLFVRQHWAQGLSASILSMAHTFMGILFFLAGRVPDMPVSTGQGTYPIIAGLGAFLCYKSMFR